MLKVTLIVERGKPLGQKVPVNVNKFLIGRGTECHLRPNSELISRLHTLILTDEDEVRLKDLGSTNGTLVNGQRVEGEVVLYEEDVIQIGPLAFLVEIEEVDAIVRAPAKPAAVGSVKPEPILGSKDVNEGELDQWLMSDNKEDVPETGSGVYDGDTQMISGMETSMDETVAGSVPSDETIANNPAENDDESAGEDVTEDGTEETPENPTEAATAEELGVVGNEVGSPDPGTQTMVDQNLSASAPTEEMQPPQAQPEMTPEMLQMLQQQQGVPYPPQQMPYMMPYPPQQMPQQMPQGMPYPYQQMPMPGQQQPYQGVPYQQQPGQPYPGQQVPGQQQPPAQAAPGQPAQGQAPLPESQAVPQKVRIPEVDYSQEEDAKVADHKVLGRKATGEKTEVKKSTEDTSGAAADILRRMMERRG